MQLHKISTNARGFTLIEMIVVIALLGMTAFFAFGWGFDVYRTYLSIDTQEKVITDLVKERSEVMSGVTEGGIYFKDLFGEVDQEITIKNVTIKTNGEITW